MLATALLACLATTGPGQDTGRKPVPPAGTYERTLPLAELLAEVPDDAWGPYPERWTLSPATLELRRRAESGELSDDEWRTALIRADTIHTRKRWPAGEPLVLWVDEQAWLRTTEIRVHAVEPELGEVSVDNRMRAGCGNCYESIKRRNRSLQLAALPKGTSQVLFEVTILQAKDLEPKRMRKLPTRRLWQGRVLLPVQAVATVEEALPSTKDGTEEIKNALRAGRSTAEANKGEASFWLRGNYSEFPMLEHTGIAFTVELWQAGRWMGSTDLVVGQGSAFNYPRSDFSGYGVTQGLAGVLTSPDVDLSTWEIRVRSSPARALPVWDADRFWSGEFTLPLSVAMSRGND